MRRFLRRLFVENALATAVVGFIFCALIGGAVRGLHYDFGRTAGAGLIVMRASSPSPSPQERNAPSPTAAPIFTRCKVLWQTAAERVADCIVVKRPVQPASPETPAPRLSLTGYVKRQNCTVTLYADQAPVERRTPEPSSPWSAFKFDVPEPLWGAQKQIVAECSHFPAVTRGVVRVSPSSQMTPNPEYFSGVGRAVHFWISPGHTQFYGVIELPRDDPRLSGALGLSSVEQLARESFNINFNFHPLYDALQDPALAIYRNNHHIFLTLKGQFQSYATVAGASHISIVVAPIELVRADSLPSPSPTPRSGGSSVNGPPDQCTKGEKWCSKVVVQFRGFNAMSFPFDDPNGFSHALGPPAQIGRDGTYVWYAPVAASQSESVQIVVSPYALITPADVHHFFSAEAKVADPLIGAVVTILHALVGVAIVTVLLHFGGFWKHEDDRNERYCGVLVAAAFGSALISAGVGLARCLFYLSLYLYPYKSGNGSFHPLLGYILWWLKWTFLVGILGAAACAALIVVVLKYKKWMKRSRYFVKASAAIFSISFLGSIYSLIELFLHYRALNDAANLNSNPMTVFSNAVLAVVLFALLMISFQPHLALQLFLIKEAAQRWSFWIVAFLFVLSASILVPSSAYFTADYSAPEFRIDTALTELAPYISSVAVVIPILWFLRAKTCGIAAAAQRRWDLALLFAVLAILTGYSYLGFPVTLMLTVLAVNYIVLRPPHDYDVIAQNLNRPREELLADAEGAYRTRAAEGAKARAFQQFLSGPYDADYDKRLAAYDKIVEENKPKADAAKDLDAVALAFGIALKPEAGLLENAQLCALVAAAPGFLLTALAGQSFITNLPTVHAPFLAGFAQCFVSILGYMAAGMGFGLAYPYIRGNIGTVKALWVILALCLAIVPYEFMSGSRSDYFAQILRWVIFFGSLGLIVDIQCIVKRGLNVRDFFNVAGVRNFAAVTGVAATILTSLATQESRSLLEIAIHYAVPAQYALPTSGAASQPPGP